MSKISLKHTSGKVVSLNSPTTEPGAADVAFKLPNADGSAGQFMKTDGSGNLSFDAVSAGITQTDSWYVNSGLDPASGGNDITANWERGTSTAFGSIGSAMTQSSGIFTFPATGIYYISIEGGFYRSGSNSHNYVGFTIEATMDSGSNYEARAVTYQALPAQSGNTYISTGCFTTFDVTNVSTHKVKFRTESDGSGTTAIDLSGRRFNVIFIRLGDT